MLKEDFKKFGKSLSFSAIGCMENLCLGACGDGITIAKHV
ncbi:hypothetical protein B4064_0915 [Caldibacillus thermoamylovorans]|nr:hypothetical protein B4064_0915 [Caldibacillus thermoamylovorans]